MNKQQLRLVDSLFQTLDCKNCFYLSFSANSSMHVSQIPQNLPRRPAATHSSARPEAVLFAAENPISTGHCLS